MRLLERLWRDRPDPRRPLLQVGVVLTRLCEHGNYTPPLFQLRDRCRDRPRHRETPAPRCHPRQLRARYGRRVVYFGSVQEGRDDAPMRISFTHIPDVNLEQD